MDPAGGYFQTTTDFSYGVAVDGDGKVYVTGDTLGNLDGQTNAGSYTMVVRKFVLWPGE